MQRLTRWLNHKATIILLHNWHDEASWTNVGDVIPPKLLDLVTTRTRHQFCEQQHDRPSDFEGFYRRLAAIRVCDAHARKR